LRRDEQARARALADATREAMSKAQTLAQALGGRVGRIVEVQETTAARPVPVYRRESFDARVASVAAAPPTPIEPGSLTITSQVQLIAEIEKQ
ncbi:MAG TPA: SIMPL domain-containing protein, partial [Pyrinomonadaceae bacterium]|nr:SIMPL domain-containing protein [Pyrinomonadaceae bacterium]